jgi:D-threo-aldose 1-dehydrogenase
MAPTARFTPPGPLGFGGAPLGNMFGVIDEPTAEGALVAAWESGVRYFDTAPHYGSGLSEHRFGNVLRRYPREEFVLSTKVGRLLRADRNAPENPPFVSALRFRGEYDYSYDGAMRSIEDSYQRLGFPQIDVVYIHDIAEDHHGAAWEDLFATAMNGAAKALISLREQGVIKAWGLGVNLTEPCERALEQSDPDLFLLAGRYSLLNQPALERLFPSCEQRGVHVVARARSAHVPDRSKLKERSLATGVRRSAPDNLRRPEPSCRRRAPVRHRGDLSGGPTAWSRGHGPV